LSFGGSVPAEFDTGWPWLCRPIADAVAAIATIDAFLMNVRRAVMVISLVREGWGTRCQTVKSAGLRRNGFGYHFPARRTS
jgi:hypothetical protein